MTVFQCYRAEGCAEQQRNAVRCPQASSVAMSESSVFKIPHHQSSGCHQLYIMPA